MRTTTDIGKIGFTGLSKDMIKCQLCPEPCTTSSRSQRGKLGRFEKLMQRFSFLNALFPIQSPRGLMMQLPHFLYYHHNSVHLIMLFCNFFIQ
jgi:hypothetical protein